MFELMPWLVGMAVLIACSAFFSASEAAFFYLKWEDRKHLQQGNRAQRIAVNLLADSDRLLTAVLFWNLVVNVVYFALVSVLAMRLDGESGAGRSISVGFTGGALLTLIVLSEMLPKSLAVLCARRLVGVMGMPLAVTVRVLDPLMPLLRSINTISRRLVWPEFQHEPSLAVTDLERAVDLSTADAKLVEQEKAALRNIVLLSDIRADEWMRPRTQFLAFQPPVSLAQLGGKMTPSGYLLVTEPSSEEVASAISLKELSDVPSDHLEHHAAPVVYVPWCSTVADALELMQRRDREVAAVVNEFGETIGILTWEDILATVYSYHPTRSERLSQRPAIERVDDGVWRVAGVTSLRRLSQFLSMPLPASKSVTIGGVVQESLKKLAEKGDSGQWGEFAFEVVDVPQRGQMTVELVMQSQSEGRR